MLQTILMSRKSEQLFQDWRNLFTTSSKNFYKDLSMKFLMDLFQELFQRLIREFLKEFSQESILYFFPNITLRILPGTTPWINQRLPSFILTKISPKMLSTLPLKFLFRISPKIVTRISQDCCPYFFTRFLPRIPLRISIVIASIIMNVSVSFNPDLI